jgi:hypothetical protein
MNLKIAVGAADLMVDVARLGVRADDQRGNAHAQAEFVEGYGGRLVIVEAADVVVRDEDGRTRPLWAAHHGVDQSGHVGLRALDRGLRMFRCRRTRAASRIREGSVPPAASL